MFQGTTVGYNAIAIVTPEIAEHFARQPLARQIWEYATMQPPGWVFRKTDIMTRFGVGDYKWRGAIRYLKESGLAEVKIHRDKSGKIFSKEIVFTTWDQRCLNLKKESHEVVEVTKNVTKKSNDFGPRIHNVEKPQRGKSTYVLPVGGCKGGIGGICDGGENEPEEVMNDNERHQMRDAFLARFSGRHTFQTFDDDKDRKNMKLARVLFKKNFLLDDLNDTGAGVFFTVNECDGKGRTAANVTRVRAVFVDLDGAPVEPVLPFNPHVVVESSPGKYHAYWLVDDFPMEAFRAMQENLADKFDGDTAVKDLPRVMRMPGYTHHKGEPFVTRVILQSYHAPLSYADTIGIFPPKKVKKFSAKRFQAVDTSGDSEWNGEWGTSEGNRNHGLASFCGWMIKRNYSHSRYEQDAHRWGRSCNPPMSDGEISGVARSIGRYAA
jgi:hypothetical protein